MRGQRQRAVTENGVVECTQVEGRAERAAASAEAARISRWPTL